MDCFRQCSEKVPARHTLCFMLFLGFMVTFLLRINMNFTIVGMVNSTTSTNDPFSKDVSKECIGHEQMATNSSEHYSEEPSYTTDVIGEFDWDEFQQSIILSSFFWGYLIFQVPGGRVAEVWGTKTVFGSSILINGILSLALPLAARLHWTLLLAIRAFQGLAQGVVFPCLSAVVAQWVPVAERARFLSFAMQGCSLGQVVTLPLCGWLLTAFGWPAVFYVSGVLAITWYFAWSMLIYDSPQEHPRISLQEKRFLEVNLQQRKSDSAPPVPWISVLTSFQFWVGVIAGIGNDWAFHTFCNFGPMYMKNALGFDLKESSWLSSLPFLSQYVFVLAYSGVCDKLLKYEVKLLTVRKMSVVVSHLLPAAAMILLSLSGCNVTMSIIVLNFCISMLGALSCGFFQNPLDIAPNYAGSLTGLVNAIGAMTAVVSTPLAGAILQANSSRTGWSYIFVITAIVNIVASAPYLLFATATLQPWNDLDNVRTRKKTFSLRQVANDDSDEPAENDALTPTRKISRY